MCVYFSRTLYIISVYLMCFVISVYGARCKSVLEISVNLYTLYLGTSWLR